MTSALIEKFQAYARRNDVEKLSNAALTSDLKELNRLIKHGVDLDAKNSAGKTALMGAAIRGNTGFVKALIRAGANLDIEATPLNLGTSPGYTALDVAEKFCSWECADVLKAAGAKHGSSWKPSPVPSGLGWPG